MVTQCRELIEARDQHHWMPIQWSRAWGLTSKTEDPGFDSCVQGSGYELLKSHDQGRNHRLVLPGFKWWSNLDQFIISMKFNDLHNPLLNLVRDIQSIPRKKPREALKTLGNIFSNQHWIEVFQKHLESEESHVTPLIRWLPILWLCSLGFQNLPEVQSSKML